MPTKLAPIFGGQLPADVIAALEAAHLELRNNFFLEKFRASELEGGRFAEAAIRACQHLAGLQVTPVGKQLPKFDQMLREFEGRPANIHDSVRLHIPRALFTVYSVRNRRDVGHIGGDVNPNRADAHFVVATCEWVLAELIRLTYSSTLAQAQAIVDSLFERRHPIVQSINGFPKILDPELSVPDKILLLLYRRGNEGASADELKEWLRSDRRNSVSVALTRLENEKAYIHRDGGRSVITHSGTRYVETKIRKELY